MSKPTHTAMLHDLNAELSEMPPEDWEGAKVVVSGILADSENLLKCFARYKLAIVADDVAHESRSFRVDAPEVTEGCDPINALARQFAVQTDDSLLYEPDLGSRGRRLVDLVRSNGAQGLVFLMMQFCDPEELDFPNVKKALDAAGIPSVAIAYDPQSCNFGQAGTSLEAFARLLKTRAAIL